MCWMCDRKATALTDYWAGSPGDATAHWKAAGSKYATALAVDGVGDLKPPVVNGLIVTPDEAGGGKDVPPGNPVLTVGAAHTIATINEIGDQDFFQVTLTAGTIYEIGQYALFGGPNGTHLFDPYIELYAADGTTLIVSADGGANTTYNETNSGFDVLLTYTPDVTGTYYVNARSYSNSSATPHGDSVGDYELFVRVQDPNDPNIYTPYYDVDEPLYAIDWGTQVNKINQSVRNPDGNEGTRDTGNAQGTPTYNVNNVAGFDMTNILTENGKTLGDITGKNVITIYFAKPGDIFASNDPTNPGLPPATITAVAVQDFEYNAVWTSLGEFEKVADIVYLEVQDKNHADFIYTSYQGTPGPGVSLLGSMSPPDESDEGLAQFNAGDERWNERDLAQGGFSFVTLIHEFGHGHGLAHPHDNGGRSGIMRGVEEEGPFNYTTGDYELNQGVFTMMSYEDGWQSSPYGNASTTAGYGYLGGLMAFDIAAIQDKYGVNEDWATGDDVYTLKDVNAAGTYYYSIWDGGGTDEIKYIGTRDTVIDLRAATLEYEFGGGGNVSYAYGIFGGFTIANGVTIENATTDAGKDIIFDNAANNVIDTGAGNDAILAFNGGADTILAGDGNDFIYFGSTFGAGDSVDAGAGNDTLSLLGAYNMTFGASQLVGIERLVMYSGSQAGVAHNSYNFTTIDANVAAGAQLAVVGRALLADEHIIFNGSAETDGSFWFNTGLGNDILVGGEQSDSFTSGGGDDQLSGGGGDDWLYGGLGADDLRGGAGSDRFVYKDAAESTAASMDHILDFQSGLDRLDLAAIDANGNAGDGDTAFTFIGAAAFSNVAGQLRAYQGAGGWFVEGDVNGDGIADLVIEVAMVGGQPLLGSDIVL